MNVTTYPLWVAAVSNLTSGNIPGSPSLYLAAELPAAIDYAEGRIYRNFNFLTTVTTDATQNTVSLNRNITVPAAFVVVNDVNIITPSGTAPDVGKRNLLTKASKEFLDLMWPSKDGATVPTLFAFLNQSQIVLGPWPDLSNYAVEFIGTQRPAPLSASNPTTFLTLNMADLFLAATMIHISGFMKNYGAQGDDPAQPGSWEGQYQRLAEGVDGEELRKRYANTIKLPPSGFDNKRMMPAAGAPGRGRDGPRSPRSADHSRLQLHQDRDPQSGPHKRRRL